MKSLAGRGCYFNCPQWSGLALTGTTAPRNFNTHYYTIAGDWDPSMTPCDFPNPDVVGFWFYFPEANDGIVPVSSVESQPYFIHLPLITVVAQTY